MFIRINGKSIALAHIAYVNWDDWDGRVGIYLAVPSEGGAQLLVSIRPDSEAAIRLREYLDAMTIPLD